MSAARSKRGGGEPRGPSTAVRARVRLARVRKRDGREAPWERAKIESAVARALDAVGEADATFAREVAELVEMALVDRNTAARAHRGHGDDAAVLEIVPGIEEIQDLVERALVELGRAAVAKAYILYRDRRARARGALAEHAAHAAADAPSRLRVREAAGAAPWDKGRIVAALMDEAELPRATAEDVAARVERRVLASGLGSVTSGLVRELVAGELCELGLDAALLRSASVGIARHDLGRLLRDPARGGAEWGDAGGGSGLADRQPELLFAARTAADRVGAAVLERYAVEDVLGAGPAELHSRGDLHVVDLGSPHRPLCAALPAELLLEGEPGPDAPFRVLGPLAELLRGVGRAVAIEEPGPLLAPLVRSARDRGAAGLGAFLTALAALSRASGRAVLLGSPGARHAGLSARLVAELAALTATPAGPYAPTLLFEDEDVGAALDAGLDRDVERLLATGRLVPAFGDEGRRCVGPGILRLWKERGALALSGAVALNLPRLARRAGPWREDAFLASLADLVRCATEICASLFAFQSSLPGFLPPRLAARPSFALVPVGLREALRVLGDGDLDPERGARALGLIAEAARRFAPPGTPRVDISAFHADQARARLAWLDRRELARDGQRWLFADAELRREGGSAPGGAYAEGYVLSPVRGMLAGQAEAELLKTVVAGALTVARGVTPMDAVDPEARTPHLALLRRFSERLAAQRGGEGALLFPHVPGHVPGRAPADLAQETA
jgi:hypothetical protein